MTYTIVLILIIILRLLTMKLGKKSRTKVFLILCFLLLGFLAGFRYEDGVSDFQVNYRRVIQAYSMDWIEVIKYSSALLHQVFRKIVATVFKDPQWYFILSSLFMVGVFMRCAKKHTADVFLFVLLYYAVFSFFPANNVTRQGIAVGVSLLAWDYLLDKKLIKFLLVMLVAALIHSSALVLVPLYFLSFKKFTRNAMLEYIFLGILIAIFNRPIVFLLQRVVYSDYVEGSYGTTSSNPLRIVLAVLTLFAMFLYVYKADNRSYIKESNKGGKTGEIRYKNFILHGSFMFIMCYVLSTLRMLMFARVALYFCPCAILCMIHGIESEKGKKNYFIFRMGIILFAILWFTAMNLAGKLIPTPYTPFWNFPTRLKL